MFLVFILPITYSIISTFIKLIYEWLKGVREKMKKPVISVLDVDSNYKYHFTMLFNRIANMFEFENVPETIDIYYLKYLLYLNGHALFFKKNSNIYIGECDIGGEPNEYYMPVKGVYANPILGSKDYDIGKNAEILFTSSADRLSMYSIPFPTASKMKYVCPTYQLISKTAELLSDCMTSINICQKNARSSYIVTAPTNAIKNTVEESLKAIYSGEPYLCAVDAGQLDNVHVLPLVNSAGSNSNLKELRETYQFYLAQFYHAIGISANSNFKRERLTDDETQVENAPLMINIIDMKNTLKDGVNRINSMFGTNIEVNLSEHWQRVAEQEEGEIENEEDVERSGENSGGDSDT